jgi:hypothetical protein
MAKAKKLAQNALIITGAVALAGMAVNAGINAAYNNVSYEVISTNFNFNQLFQGRVGLDIQVKIKNGNPVGASISHVTGEIKYGQLKVADVNVNLPLNIPANGEVVGTLNLSIEAISFVTDVVNIFTNIGGNVASTLINTIKLTGYIYFFMPGTTVLGVPISINIPVTVGA